MGDAQPPAARPLAPLQACQVGLTWRMVRRVAFKAGGGGGASPIDGGPTVAPAAAAARAGASSTQGSGTLFAQAAPKKRQDKRIAVLVQGGDSEATLAPATQHGAWGAGMGAASLCPASGGFRAYARAAHGTRLLS